jgi:hypothetical protein
MENIWTSMEWINIESKKVKIFCASLINLQATKKKGEWRYGSIILDLSTR